MRECRIRVVRRSSIAAVEIVRGGVSSGGRDERRGGTALGAPVTCQQTRMQARPAL